MTDLSKTKLVSLEEDFRNTLTDNGLSEMVAMGLTTVWMAKVLGN